CSTCSSATIMEASAELYMFYMFFGNDHGGERGALLYGLIGSCRLNGIDPEAYLRHILSVLPEWPSNRVDELLPWNVVFTDK
ncbi:TPA: transposase domain-containing protein, partial [Escherichia coli]|nr:transposase domain-containing protein [Escherichia coli]HCT2353949.1 transposase domain-containing protein [Escherichia coli]